MHLLLLKKVRIIIFLPKGIGIDDNDYRMWIYNKWGHQIFYTKDLYKGWDGKIMGKNEFAPAGVYVYRIILNDFSGAQHEVTGAVTLIK